MQLIWDGEIDSGKRVAALAEILRLNPIPAGVHRSACSVEISTRSAWAIVTWAVSAVMIWFGVTAENWYLLVLAPFMVGAAIMQSLGRICVLIRDGQVEVFEGVGWIGRRRKLPLGSFRSLEYAVKRGRGGSTAWIVIHGSERDVKFGRHLNEEQIHYVLAFLLDA